MSTAKGAGFWVRLRAAGRRKHELPWRAETLEWLNAEQERVREGLRRRRVARTES
ncbi:MAG TPA: hypothetical protein VI172_08440 [Candidatus Dormibacteraeota bacterium]